MAQRTAIQVEGARELRREIRRLNDRDLKRALRLAYREAARPVAEEAERSAPRRSGKLALSIDPRGTQTEARVKVGNGTTVPYAGPITYGWPARNIEADPYIRDAIREKLGDVRDTLEIEIRHVMQQLDTRRLSL